MSDHVERMQEELTALTEKTEKLGLFIATNEVFETLDQDDKNLMQAQFGTMNAYKNILTQRIARAGN